MSIWNFLSGVAEPVTKLVDELHTSDEERLQIKAKLFEMQTSMAAKAMDYEARLVEAKTSVITAEAQGASWLQRNWRPITMLTFLALVVPQAGSTTGRNKNLPCASQPLTHGFRSLGYKCTLQWLHQAFVIDDSGLQYSYQF